MTNMPFTVKEQEVVAAEILYPFDLIQLQVLYLDVVRNTLDKLVRLLILTVGYIVFALHAGFEYFELEDTDNAEPERLESDAINTELPYISDEAPVNNEEE